ncbi:unnamed protein product [Thelazia callipaeda]|uniref:KH_dom_type_1 domain-containing protein n=1 Tax=Thelazia callipaeda TaxID=103827 RepID=A0A0N5CUS2_THECL|nr:unnamed protein product [Thelazia callipaeda]
MSDGSVDERRPSYDERELASKSLSVQDKRFYVDVKQNNRGRFIKLAEVGSGRRKSQLTLSMSAAAAFRDHLDQFVKFFDGLGIMFTLRTSGEEPSGGENGHLKSEVIVLHLRQYFLKLKENERGRYLLVFQMVLKNPQFHRPPIALPATGMAQLRDTLTELIDKYAEGYLIEYDTYLALPKPKHVRADNKMFIFVVDRNERGTFLRILEVKKMGRCSSITVPMSSWGAFQDVLSDLQEKVTPSNEIKSGKEELKIKNDPEDDKVESKTSSVSDTEHNKG